MYYIWVGAIFYFKYTYFVLVCVFAASTYRSNAVFVEPTIEK